MGVYLYPNNTETELKNAYIWIPFPTSIVLDKNFISLTTVWQTGQLTATIEPEVSDKTITWSSDDTTIATVSTTGLVTCVTPWECTITATTVNGLTASCSVGQWYNRTLYKETDFSNSSYWWFRTTWWASSASPSNVAFDTTNWYVYTTSSHAKLRLSPDTNDISLFQSANAIKIVFDWLNQPLNTHRYWCSCGCYGFLFNSSNSIFSVNGRWLNNITLESWTACSEWNWYSWYIILKKNSSDVYTYLDNWTIYKGSWFDWNAAISTNVNWLFYPSASDSLSGFWVLDKDQWNGGMMKDIHVYIA